MIEFSYSLVNQKKIVTIYYLRSSNFQYHQEISAEIVEIINLETNLIKETT